jgi:hypothetical protein
MLAAPGTDSVVGAYPGMTRLLSLITAVAALALPATAVAKEPVKATVCGAGGCVTSKDRAAILPLTEGGPLAPGPSKGAPAYRVRLTIAAGETSSGRPHTESFTTWFAPSLHRMRGADGTWMELPTATLAALRHVAPGLRPFPAARLPLGGQYSGPGSDSLAPETYAPQPAPAPEASAGRSPLLLGGIGLAAIAALAGTLLIVRRRRTASPGRPAPAA